MNYNNCHNPQHNCFIMEMRKAVFFSNLLLITNNESFFSLKVVKLVVSLINLNIDVNSVQLKIGKQRKTTDMSNDE